MVFLLLLRLHHDALRLFKLDCFQSFVSLNKNEFILVRKLVFLYLKAKGNLVLDLIALLQALEIRLLTFSKNESSKFLVFNNF